MDTKKPLKVYLIFTLIQHHFTEYSWEIPDTLNMATCAIWPIICELYLEPSETPVCKLPATWARNVYHRKILICNTTQNHCKHVLTILLLPLEQSCVKFIKTVMHQARTKDKSSFTRSTVHTSTASLLFKCYWKRISGT